MEATAMAEKSGSKTGPIVIVVVVVLVVAALGGYLLVAKPGASSTASVTCTPSAGIEQTISLSNASSPVAIQGGTDLVFPLPVPAGRLNPQVDNSFNVTEGGQIEVSIYNASNYAAFQSAFNAKDNASSGTDTGGSSVATLYSSNGARSASTDFSLPNDDETFDLVYTNAVLGSSATVAIQAELMWALPTCGP
ncbi:MAG TPA: hypothetical protein VEJ36_02725 [Nitrososphaerales archaeon]|nr:hypothetical protein [Nitrososphaerales archaeon]